MTINSRRMTKEGPVADKSSQIVLEALSKAVADPAGLPLHGSKAVPGLFAGNNSAKQAAQQCKEEGYLRVVRTETRGKTTQEVCAITEKGLAYLLSQVSPRKVLEDLVHTLQSRQNEASELLVSARHMQANLDQLKATAEKVLLSLSSGQHASSSSNGHGAGTGSSKNGTTGINGEARNGTHALTAEQSWTKAILTYLERWHETGASEDCPLSELYRQTCKTASQLTIGQFHDGLRRLHDQQKIYLHPWTGPMYDIPEPPYALLVGHSQVRNRQGDKETRRQGEKGKEPSGGLSPCLPVSLSPCLLSKNTY